MLDVRIFLFQYPRLDRRVENSHPVVALFLIYLGFSIHDWIEGSKTTPDGQGGSTEAWFQYPRLDRRVENRTLRLFAVWCASFSIHDWIEGSKTRRITVRHRRDICFSIHDWIEGSKTAKPIAEALAGGGFSIHDWIEGSKTLIL